MDLNVEVAANRVSYQKENQASIASVLSANNDDKAGAIIGRESARAKIIPKSPKESTNSKKFSSIPDYKDVQLRGRSIAEGFYKVHQVLSDIKIICRKHCSSFSHLPDRGSQGVTKTEYRAVEDKNTLSLPPSTMPRRESQQISMKGRSCEMLRIKSENVVSGTKGEVVASCRTSFHHQSSAEPLHISNIPMGQSTNVFGITSSDDEQCVHVTSTFDNDVHVSDGCARANKRFIAPITLGMARSTNPFDSILSDEEQCAHGTSTFDNDVSDVKTRADNRSIAPITLGMARSTNPFDNILSDDEQCAHGTSTFDNDVSDVKTRANNRSIAPITLGMVRSTNPFDSILSDDEQCAHGTSTFDNDISDGNTRANKRYIAPITLGMARSTNPFDSILSDDEQCAHGTSTFDNGISDGNTRANNRSIAPITLGMARSTNPFDSILSDDKQCFHSCNPFDNMPDGLAQAYTRSTSPGVIVPVNTNTTPEIRVHCYQQRTDAMIPSPYIIVQAESLVDIPSENSDFSKEGQDSHKKRSVKSDRKRMRSFVKNVMSTLFSCCRSRQRD